MDSYSGLLASRTQLEVIISVLDTQKVNITHFVVSILQHSSFTQHPAVDDLLTHSDILNALLQHPRSTQTTLAWTNNIIKKRYASSIKELAQKNNGWHFTAARATAEQLESFRIEDIGREIKRLAAEIWDVVGLMLCADQRLAAEASSEDDLMETEEEGSEREPNTRAQRNAE